MTILVPDWLAENIAWVAVVAGAGGFGSYLWRRASNKNKSSGLRRQDDQILIELVKQDIAAFKGLEATMQDNKNISIGVANTLVEIQKTMAAIAEQMRMLDHPHRRTAHS